jgi:hypothetical protein
MPGTNDFRPFATGGGANVQAQNDFAADTVVPSGFLSGLASSAKFNKVFRQSSVWAHVLGQIIADTNVNALDDGNMTGLKTAFLTALGSNFFKTETGSWNVAILNTNPSSGGTTKTQSLTFTPKFNGLMICFGMCSYQHAAFVNRTDQIIVNGAPQIDQVNTPFTQFGGFPAVNGTPITITQQCAFSSAIAVPVLMTLAYITVPI